MNIEFDFFPVGKWALVYLRLFFFLILQIAPRGQATQRDMSVLLVAYNTGAFRINFYNIII